MGTKRDIKVGNLKGLENVQNLTFYEVLVCEWEFSHTSVNSYILLTIKQVGIRT